MSHVSAAHQGEGTREAEPSTWKGEFRHHFLQVQTSIETGSGNRLWSISVRSWTMVGVWRGQNHNHMEPGSRCFWFCSCFSGGFKTRTSIICSSLRAFQRPEIQTWITEDSVDQLRVCLDCPPGSVLVQETSRPALTFPPISEDGFIRTG